MAEYTKEQRIAEGNRLLALNEMGYDITSSAPAGEGFAYLDQIPTTEQDLINLGYITEPEKVVVPNPVNTTPVNTTPVNTSGTSGSASTNDGVVDGVADAGSNEPTPYEAFVTQQKEMLEAQRLQDAANALEIIKEKLAEYGLEGLADLAHNLLLDGASPDSVVLQLRDTPEFAARFPGMQIRRDNKMSAIAPDQYIALERFYKQVMMAAGMPEGFYDSVDDFAQFIGNDVDEDEFKDRVTMAAVAVQNIDPYLKGQLRDLYGIGVENEGELIAYYLDPQRGTDIIEQRLQLEAAGLSSASMGALGSGFNQKIAEQLVDRNIQKREIADRFRGQRAITQQLVGEDEFTASEFAAAEFGLDSDATADLARLRELRAQRGVRQSGALLTRTGATGLSTAT